MELSDTMIVPDWLKRLITHIIKLQRGRVYLITLNLSSRPEWAITEIGDIRR